MDRCDELARTLDVLRDQGDGFPTVVVDNASQDGTPEMVRREHPEVELVHLPVNLAAAGPGLKRRGRSELTAILPRAPQGDGLLTLSSCGIITSTINR